jgi:hypothetical protein
MQVKTFDKGQNFCCRSKLSLQVKTFDKGQNFCCRSKLSLQVKTFDIGQNFCCRSKLLMQVKTFDIGQNFRQSHFRMVFIKILSPKLKLVQFLVIPTQNTAT